MVAQSDTPTNPSTTEALGASWAHVQWCLEQGWSVFPLWGVVRVDGALRCACKEGAECDRPGKHPAWAGGHNAAVDLAAAGQLQRWWADESKPWNIGIRTGLASALLVLDVDPRNGGDDSMDQWTERTGLEWVPGARATTGAGRHEYFRWPAEYLDEGIEIGGVGAALPGVDVKCGGGYVVGPGSAHVSGKRYEWLGGTIPDAPIELVQWMQSIRGKGTTAGTEKPSGYDYAYCLREGAPEGMRDVFFNELAFRLRTGGITRTRAEARMREEFERAEPGHSWERVLYQVDRVYAISDADLALREGKGYTFGEPATAQQMSLGQQLMARQQEKNKTPTAEAEGVLEPGGTVAQEDPEVQGPIMTEYIRQLSLEEPTDTGNAERLFRLLGGNVFYISEAKAQEWYMWDERDGYWQEVTHDQIIGLTIMVLDELHVLAKEYMAMGDKDTGTAWFKWAQSSASFPKRCAMANALRVDTRIQRNIADLNPTSSDWLIPLPGAKTIEVDSETGAWVLRPSRREDMITRLAGVHAKDVEAAIAANAHAGDGGALGEHINYMVRGCQDRMTWLRQYAATSLLGTTQYAMSAWLFGEGANGKNVLISNWLGGMLGSFYAIAQPTLLTGNGENSHPVEMMTIRDARLVFVDEVENKMVNAARFKSVVGEGRVRTRGMGTNWIEFKSTAKLWVASNGRPAVRDNSHGFWRRVRIVELPGTVGENGWVKRPDAWKISPADLAVGLVWLLASLAEVVPAGEIKDTKAILASTNAYRKREDIIGEWVEDHLVVVLDEVTGLAREDVWVLKDQLMMSYSAWIGRNYPTSKPVSLNRLCEQLFKELGELGVKEAKPRIGDMGKDGYLKQVRVIAGVQWA